jgi:hypothetical protein
MGSIKTDAQQTVLRNWGGRKESQHQIISKLQLMGGHWFFIAAAFGYALSAAASLWLNKNFVSLSG